MQSNSNINLYNHVETLILFLISFTLAR